MKYTLLLIVAFATVIIYAGTDLLTGIVGLTQLNGEGCLCHNLSSDPTVNVWVEGPDTLEQNQTALYRIKMTGGPAITGGFNVAARFSNISVTDAGTQEIDSEITHTDPRHFSNDTVSWSFNFTASNSVSWDTIYSVGQSVNNDSIPSTLDRWNFGPKFPVRIIPPVPVELSSFTAQPANNGVLLKWQTSSEVNNRGFEILRLKNDSHLNSDWESISFITGNGTTSEQNSYSFNDENLAAGNYSYKLKQVDFDGTFKFSEIINVDIIVPDFTLMQNFPNPFNPSTTISYNLSNDSRVVLKVFNSIGEQVAVLVDGFVESGHHKIIFDAGNELTSGVYFYSFEATSNNNSVSVKQVRKMLLLR
ncbi:MAG: hypothetical protein IPM56_06915 [Ignavibacteriales bacterium]|nr:MAG: hypothetical protein IPM56_06915 [Ignavibacteriales bacterium]